MTTGLPARLAQNSFVRFCLIGAVGYVVDAVVLALCTERWGIDPYRARVLSIAVAMTVTWLGNRYLTFAARRARGSIAAVAQEALKFAGANMVGAVVNYAVYAALLRFAPAPLDNPYVAQAFGVLGGLVFNFTLSHLLVFRSPVR